MCVNKLQKRQHILFVRLKHDVICQYKRIGATFFRSAAALSLMITPANEISIIRKKHTSNDVVSQNGRFFAVQVANLFVSLYQMGV